MTMEEIFDNLIRKYGDGFRWQMIPSAESQSFFVDELKRELGEDNAVFRSGVYAVAKCDSDDDVLFLICDGSAEGLWRIYHLTYASHHAPEFPRYREFASGKAVGDYMENRLREELL